MGYIHCCGTLHETKTYRLVPEKNFSICELDKLTKCPVCGHTVVQLTRIGQDENPSTVRKTNIKARIFFLKLKPQILYEEKPQDYTGCGKYYLDYNEYGVKKRCYSNLRSLKMGLHENK